jgi:hypothetical protein
MAKLLVMMDGLDEETAEVGEAIFDGARSVRFAEADLMRLTSDRDTPRLRRMRVFQGPDALASYDAVVLGAGAEGLGLVDGLLRDLAGTARHGRLANKLGSIFPSTAPATTGGVHPLWDLLAPMAGYGMILVPPGYAGPTGEPEDRLAAARRLGKRLIDIAGWIMHARSHHHH